MAYEHFSSLLEAKESSEIVFADNEVPTAQNNYALCKVCVGNLIDTRWSRRCVKHQKLLQVIQTQQQCNYFSFSF